MSNFADFTQGTQYNFLQERITYGRPAAEVIIEEVEKLGKSRVFITTSKSLAKDDGLPRAIGRALGEKFAGMFSEIPAHTPRQCVIDGANAARDAQADLLVAIGGGSVTDATKAMLLCLWHELKDPESMSPFIGGRQSDPSQRPVDAASRIRMLAVPTMFSAAEFTWHAGVTDPSRLVKEIFSNPMLVPQVVVLDPAATLASPMSNLIATGMKAVDHAVERLCAFNTSPLADAAASTALKMLHESLPRLAVEHDNLKLRLDCQFGMWLSIFGGTSGVRVGASHAIGHTIGGYGVPHGHTTGVCLPSALKWNYDFNGARQCQAGAVIGVSGDELAEAIRDFASSLGLPTRLRDVGIEHSTLGDIAEKAMRDPSMATNPKPVSSAAQVREMLDLAW